MSRYVLQFETLMTTLPFNELGGEWERGGECELSILGSARYPCCGHLLFWTWSMTALGEAHTK